MHVSGRTFHLFLGAVALGGLRSSVPGYAENPQVEQKRRSHIFSEDRTLETIFLTSLGRAYHYGANPGKVLHLTRQVKDGDFESPFVAFRQADDEARAIFAVAMTLLVLDL